MKERYTCRQEQEVKFSSHDCARARFVSVQIKNARRTWSWSIGVLPSIRPALHLPKFRREAVISHYYHVVSTMIPLQYGTVGVRVQCHRQFLLPGSKNFQAEIPCSCLMQSIPLSITRISIPIQFAHHPTPILSSTTLSPHKAPSPSCTYRCLSSSPPCNRNAAHINC